MRGAMSLYPVTPFASGSVNAGPPKTLSASRPFSPSGKKLHACS